MKYSYHIQFYRFIGSMIIMLNHWNALHKIPAFQGGYIFVEFFFILSGFLMASRIIPYKKDGANGSPLSAANEAWEYTKKKFCSLFPYSITAGVAMFIGISIVLQYSKTEIAKKFLDTVWEMSLIFMSGIGGTNYRFNGQSWFASSLLIVGYFVYYSLKRHPDFYSRIVAPASILLIYAFFWNRYTTICKAATFDTSINIELALIRTLAGLNLGIVCYVIYTHLYNKYENVQLSYLHRLILSFAELAACIFFIIMIYKFSYSTYDYLLIVTLCFIIILSFLNFGYGSRLFENKFVNFIGKLSMPICFNHVFIYAIVLRGAESNLASLFTYYIFTIAISAIEYLLYEFIRKSILKKHT